MAAEPQKLIDGAEGLPEPSYILFVHPDDARRAMRVLSPIVKRVTGQRDIPLTTTLFICDDKKIAGIGVRHRHISDYYMAIVRSCQQYQDEHHDSREKKWHLNFKFFSDAKSEQDTLAALQAPFFATIIQSTYDHKALEGTLNSISTAVIELSNAAQWKSGFPFGCSLDTGNIAINVTSPGTQDLITQLLRKSGFKAGKDFQLKTDETPPTHCDHCDTDSPKELNPQTIQIKGSVLIAKKAQAEKFVDLIKTHIKEIGRIR